MFCSGCDRTALSDWYIGQMHRFHPSRPQHGLHLGSTLANKAPTSAQLGPTYLQLRPNLAPNMRNLAPSWARLGATSAQVEVHMASKWGTWPSCVLSCATLDAAWASTRITSLQLWVHPDRFTDHFKLGRVGPRGFVQGHVAHVGLVLGPTSAHAGPSCVKHLRPNVPNWPEFGAS